jgi:23S rRNA pseudouridine1911/1915/1917 synthase
MQQIPSVNIPSSEDFRSIGGPASRDNCGRRVDEYLAKNYPFLSRAGWQKRIEKGEVLVSGRKVRVSYGLREGDTIHYYHPREHEPEADMNVKVIYEEKGVLCAYKPPDLPMHENGKYRKNTFFEAIKTVAGKEWAAVHRLDRETSGVVVCGATYEIRRALTQQVMDRKFKKEYLAICQGVAAEDDWYLDAPLGKLKTSAIRIKNWVVEDGDEAQTQFVVEKRAANHTMLRAMPLTGRTNQIRIHAAYGGLPIVGDKLYHNDEAVFLDYFENGVTDFVIEKTGHTRCCLHAAVISFVHPETKERLTVESEMADDMKEVWEKLTV